MRLPGNIHILLLLIILLAVPPSVPGQEKAQVRFVRTGLFVEMSGGGTGVAGDVKNQSGPFLGGRVGYVIASTFSFDLRFVSGKTMLNDVSLYPGTTYQPRIGTVAVEGAVRLLKGSPIYPILFAGYGYSTLLENPYPVYNGNGYVAGVGVIYHFTKYFSVGANGFFNRTWYHVRNLPAGATEVKFTDNRLGVEFTLGFWPGVVP
jgi:Outer membrane protein beta-barrel domain